jgi:hypothetical protein
MTLFIPRQVREIHEWRPWQQQVFLLSKMPNNPYIEYIYHPDGNIGKSTLCTAMCVYKHAQRIPVFDKYKDILRMVTETSKLGCYIVDLPRTANHLPLDQLFKAL